MLSTAAGMPGLLHISLIALLAGCGAFKLGSSQRVIPLNPPVFKDGGPARPHFIQALVRTKRQSVHQLVRVQPRLIHDMGSPVIQEVSQAKVDSANSSETIRPPVRPDAASTRMAVDESVDVEDEMERMVHLVAPQDAEGYRGRSDSPETAVFSGPGAGDASLEASGFYGMDTEDRGDDRERRAGEDEWERDTGEERERRGGDTRREEEDNRDVLGALESNHTTPDLDALIGYSPSFRPSGSRQPGIFSPPVEVRDSGLQEHRASPVLEGPPERDLWEVEGDEDGHSSGDGVLHSSVTASTAAAGGDAAGTATPETDTGTDFGLLGSYSKDKTEDEEADREEEEEDESDLAGAGVFTQNPTVPEVGMAPSREPLQPSMEEEEEHEGRGRKDKGEEEEEEEEEDKWRKRQREETRVRHIPLMTDVSPTTDLADATWDWLETTAPPKLENQQVLCVDWSQLTGRGYVILNMTHNMNCEEFRADQGKRLLKIMERVFARRMNSPEGSWVLYLSKPTHQQHQLLMNVASEHGVIATKEALDMLGEIRKNLNEVGIQNYSAASSCQSRPSQTRSDYSKLFVVLVIIGSVCMVIITSGFIYICWQRRLPATKSTFRAEELHFVENGCHDNPTLDVTNDSQPEMQEKKPSTNGLTGGGEGGGAESSRWQVFVNQAATGEEEEEEEEQDTHL